VENRKEMYFNAAGVGGRRLNSVPSTCKGGITTRPQSYFNIRNESVFVDKCADVLLSERLYKSFVVD
jgi:hypothetical protein